MPLLPPPFTSTDHFSFPIPRGIINLTADTPHEGKQTFSVNTREQIWSFGGNTLSETTIQLPSSPAMNNTLKKKKKEWAQLCSNKILFMDTEIWISHNSHVSQNNSFDSFPTI